MSLVFTFSAGTVTAVLFKKYTGTKVIGEPAGDELVFLAEGGNVMSPNSKINAHYSNGFHHGNFNNNFSIEPDKLIYVYFDDNLRGDDSIMNYIIKD